MKKKKWQLKMTRRQVLKAGMIGGGGLMLPWKFKLGKAYAVPLDYSGGLLNDPAKVKKFVLSVPDALDPTFKYSPVGMGSGKTTHYKVGVSAARQVWGLKDEGLGSTSRLSTDIYGYGGTWPGKTFEVQSRKPVQVEWSNNLVPGPSHLLNVDLSLHWCYSLPGYEDRTIIDDGVPIVVHVHGHHSQYRSDGNPEQFFTSKWKVKGPRFRGRTSIYHNDQVAGNLWYHDHALGITRLNVYAGMAGFYFVRDEIDTGTSDNPLGLPAWPYEKAYAIQDRMFEQNGQLYYPSLPGDPAWTDFIDDEGVAVCDDPPTPPATKCVDPPSALAEFFGDHMVVNGRAWPKENVEPRNYRLHLLNGCDSRFMVIRFRAVRPGVTEIPSSAPILPFDVIGSDQGLSDGPEQVTHLVFEPGSRYDIVFDFKGHRNQRIIMENIGGDAPFGGAFGNVLGPDDFFDDRQTDRIMAFDVEDIRDVADAYDSNTESYPYQAIQDEVTNTRQVALFEGKDEYGRLQPLLGTVGPAKDFTGKDINWPNTKPYIDADLSGPMEGAIAWHSPTTENPKLNATEIWEIFNATGDAHPIHLHLVHFDIIDRQNFQADIVDQKVVQHDGSQGQAFRLENIILGSDANVGPDDGYVENAPKDMVTALPTQRTGPPPEGKVWGQVTRIKMTFDKPGRYVWHCHILSHEDHEMMRTLYVGPEF